MTDHSRASTAFFGFGVLIAVAGIAAATALCLALPGVFGGDSLILLFALVVLGSASVGGRPAGLLAVVLGAAVLLFFSSMQYIQL